MVAVTHARVAVRGGRPRGWWAKAWLRAVEEAAYGEDDLKRGRSLARAGHVGSVRVDAGSFVAAVAEGDATVTVGGSVATWDDEATDTLVELVAAEARRVSSLLAGDLPLGLVEDAEEAGVELVPYAGELASECTCEAWVDPCRHAVAVMVVLGRLLDADPLVLLHLRGLDREDLLARLGARAHGSIHGPASGTTDDAAAGGLDGAAGADLETGLDAALRARRVLELLDRGEVSVAHLL